MQSHNLISRDVMQAWLLSHDLFLNNILKCRKTDKSLCIISVNCSPPPPAKTATQSGSSRPNFYLKSLHIRKNKITAYVLDAGRYLRLYEACAGVRVLAAVLRCKVPMLQQDSSFSESDPCLLTPRFSLGGPQLQTPPAGNRCAFFPGCEISAPVSVS